MCQEQYNHRSDNCENLVKNQFDNKNDTNKTCKFVKHALLVEDNHL